MTQYRSYIEGLKKMDEKQVAEQEKNWGGDGSLTLGKSHVPGKVTDDVFAGVNTAPIPFAPVVREAGEPLPAVSAELGGPWRFYEKFWRAHGLTKLPKPANPEIAIKYGATLLIPLELHNHTESAKAMKISLITPDGWTTQSGTGSVLLDPEGDYFWQLTTEAPKVETKAMHEIECRVEADGKILATVKLSVRLVHGGLPQN